MGNLLLLGWRAVDLLLLHFQMHFSPRPQLSIGLDVVNLDDLKLTGSYGVVVLVHLVRLKVCKWSEERSLL